MTTHLEAVQKLSEQSVSKYYQAYRDVPWDDPEFALTAEDPRHILPAWHHLGEHEWYQGLSEEVKARLGLQLGCQVFKVGEQFEAALLKGLTTHAFRLPDNTPDFRYIYHEMIEECQHSLMFQEFINRSGLNVKGMRWWLKPFFLHADWQAQFVPELFFVATLAGEEGTDHYQRLFLQEKDVHPLRKMIYQYHVIEESRHISYAQSYLREHFHKANAFKKFFVRLNTPIIMTGIGFLAYVPHPHTVKEYGIPDHVVREVYKGENYRQFIRQSFQKLTDFCREMEVLTPSWEWLWRRCGLL